MGRNLKKTEAGTKKTSGLAAARFEQMISGPGLSSKPLLPSGLQRLNVRGLQALGAADDFELDRLAVVQRLIAIRLDRREVHEYIFSGLALDETKALAGIKPLDCSLFFTHFIYSFR
jgi:hypothetical protein